MAQHIWLALLVWGLIYLSDYLLTIYSARLYQTYLSQYVVFEGSFELTPYFQKEVNALQWVSFRFWTVWILSLILIWLVWFLAVIALKSPWIFSLAYGALFLREASVHLRHARNLALSLVSRASGGLEGQLKYSRRLILKMSALELFSFAAFCLVITLVLGSWFFLGGVISCLYSGVQHWLMSRKQFKPSVNKEVAQSAP